MLMTVKRARSGVEKARAEEHGDESAKESVIPHLVPP
jgi:hypothetical protein